MPRDYVTYVNHARTAVCFILVVWSDTESLAKIFLMDSDNLVPDLHTVKPLGNKRRLVLKEEDIHIGNPESQLLSSAHGQEFCCLIVVARCFHALHAWLHDVGTR